jgi:hypothetical protein
MNWFWNLVSTIPLKPEKLKLHKTSENTYLNDDSESKL